MEEEERLLEISDGGEYIFGFRNDGIIHLYFRSNSIVDASVKEKIKDMVNARFGYRDMTYICQAGKNVWVRSSALHDSRLIDESMPSIGTVLVIESPFMRLLARLYLLFWPSLAPVKIVSDFSRGIRWLHKKQAEYKMLG